MTTATADFLAVGDGHRDWSNGQIPRESPPYERPLLEPPAGGYLEPYTRSSGFGDTYTDKTALTEWLIRMAMIGVAVDESLILAICAHHEDQKMMRQFKKQAHDNAEAGAAATTGTALHKLCDAYDAGQSPYVPPKFQGDVQAYLEATRSLEVVEAEQFCVNETYHCAGTPDRLYRLKRDLRLPDKYSPEKGRRVIPRGTVVIGDLKTGKKLDHGHIKFAAQLFLYAAGQRYVTNPDRMYSYKNYEDQMPGGDRTPWLPDEEVDQSDGLVIYMPSGSGVAELRPIDLERGRRVCEFAAQTREERKLKTIGPKIEVGPMTWAEKIAETGSRDELMAVWHAAVEAQEWTESLTELARVRIAELERAA